MSESEHNGNGSRCDELITHYIVSPNRGGALDKTNSIKWPKRFEVWHRLVFDDLSPWEAKLFLDVLMVQGRSWSIPEISCVAFLIKMLDEMKRHKVSSYPVLSCFLNYFVQDFRCRVMVGQHIKLTEHHIIPSSRGGERPDNIVHLPLAFHSAFHNIFQNLLPEEVKFLLGTLFVPGKMWSSKDIHYLITRIKGEAY